MVLGELRRKLVHMEELLVAEFMDGLLDPIVKFVNILVAGTPNDFLDCALVVWSFLVIHLVISASPVFEGRTMICGAILSCSLFTQGCRYFVHG